MERWAAAARLYRLTASMNWGSGASLARASVAPAEMIAFDRCVSLNERVTGDGHYYREELGLEGHEVKIEGRTRSEQ